MSERLPNQTTPEKAIEAIQSGNNVILGTGCSEPQTLVGELIRQRGRLRNVCLLTMANAGKCEYARPEMAPHFRVMAIVASAGLTDAMRAGRADYLPCNLSEVPRLFTEGYYKPDVAMIQVSPPDENGYCSYGISVDYTKPAAEMASIVIAEVNDRMPRTLGDCYIHLSDIDLAVESSRPLLTIDTAQRLSEVETAIGSLVASLVTDEATIEVGIGGIPDAVLRSLLNKRNLRVHTGIISDGIIPLVQSGAMVSPNSGQMPVIAGLAMGSQTLYDFLHENPAIEMRPCTYTHNANILSKIRGLVAVNSAVQIDLTGQVNAESVGGVEVSGTGGQMDFVRGASVAPEGKSVIALPSTAGGGRISRIVAKLGDGAVVTTPRSDVHYVVTEYGIADLRGKSLTERACTLAAIAHPAFRADLLAAGQR